MSNPINFATSQPNINYTGSHEVGIGGCNIDTNSNHPEIITKKLPDMIGKRLSKLCSTKEAVGPPVAGAADSASAAGCDASSSDTKCQQAYFDPIGYYEAMASVEPSPPLLREDLL